MSTTSKSPATSTPPRAPALAPRLFWSAAALGLAAAALLAYLVPLALTTDVPIIGYEDRPVTRAVFRVFYIHVPAAFAMYVMLGGSLIGSVGYLATRSERMDRLQLASTEVALLFATFVLASGMLWAQNIWGVAWSWEPRLVSTLVLWLAMVGALTLRRSVEDVRQKRMFSAVFGLLVCATAPFVHWATKWFGNEFHPNAGAGQSVGVGYGERREMLMQGTGTMIVVGAALIALRLYHERLIREAARLRRVLDPTSG